MSFFLRFCHRKRRSSSIKIFQKHALGSSSPGIWISLKPDRRNLQLSFSRRLLDWRRGDRAILRTAAGRRERRKRAAVISAFDSNFFFKCGTGLIIFRFSFFFFRVGGEAKKRERKGKKQNLSHSLSKRKPCPASPAAASRRPSASPRAWPTATRAMRGEEKKKGKEMLRTTNDYEDDERRRYLEENQRLPNAPFSALLGSSPLLGEAWAPTFASSHSLRTMQLTRPSKISTTNVENKKQKNSAHAAGSAGASHDAVAVTPWSQPPQCDICRCAPAMLLCTDDRAVMCRG